MDVYSIYYEERRIKGIVKRAELVSDLRAYVAGDQGQSTPILNLVPLTHSQVHECSAPRVKTNNTMPTSLSQHQHYGPLVFATTYDGSIRVS
ncbi:hypothetical protein Ciccas_008700 [Cichlidogyrus casuarinus]|uniref:Uncharacterized protein n=1 Tax=Cichlidogyrus casuarinus TaxID=1844966 RepID=A0ABD2PZ53_9PLAT